MTFDVEVGIVDPYGTAHAERHAGELLAVARRASEARGYVFEQVVERLPPGGRIGVGWRPVHVASMAAGRAEPSD